MMGIACCHKYLQNMRPKGLILTHTTTWEVKHLLAHNHGTEIPPSSTGINNCQRVNHLKNLGCYISHLKGNVTPLKGKKKERTPGRTCWDELFLPPGFLAMSGCLSPAPEAERGNSPADGQQENRQFAGQIWKSQHRRSISNQQYTSI